MYPIKTDIAIFPIMIRPSSAINKAIIDGIRGTPAINRSTFILLSHNNLKYEAYDGNEGIKRCRVSKSNKSQVLIFALRGLSCWRILGKKGLRLLGNYELCHLYFHKLKTTDCVCSATVIEVYQRFLNSIHWTVYYRFRVCC